MFECVKKGSMCAYKCVVNMNTGCGCAHTMT